MSKELISKQDVANILEISQESVTNWIKHGYIKNYGNYFNINEILELKNKIKKNEINRLNIRANKSNSSKEFIPREYISDKKSLNQIIEIINYIHKNCITIDNAIFLLSINKMIREHEVIIENIERLHNLDSNISFIRKEIKNHFSSWYKKIDIKLNSVLNKLIIMELPTETDILGIIYQSLLKENTKSNAGSYYTPPKVVQDLTSEGIQRGDKVLDPCCGTGQFLLFFSKYITNPNDIYGFDIDFNSVNIAKINLFLQYKDIDFTPNVYQLNSLTESEETNFKNFFNYIATNPPWGAKYNKSDLNLIRKSIPEIKSKESFSFFIAKSMHFLKDDGTMALVLPQSFSNVQKHKDVRELMLKNTSIFEIKILGKIFTNVFSPVITIKASKQIKNNSEILIINGNSKYTSSQKRFLKNDSYIFDIHINNKDISIITKLFQKNFITLKDNSEWALGIVTGDNHKYIYNEQIKQSEIIFKGSDVTPYFLKKSSSFIIFDPSKFQQVAPIEIYRAKEKLIYKFISDSLIFAYDNKGYLTLNSANILIPKIPDYSIKIILGFLNSKLFNYFFKKKFNSIKILKSNIEELPFPILNNKQILFFSNFVNSILNGKNTPEELDRYIYQLYNLNDEEINTIEDFLNKK